MKKLFPILLGVFFSISCGSLFAQVLPNEWEGTWFGTVDIWSYNQKTDSFPMSVTIEAQDSAWSFILNYDRDPQKPDVRNYQLIVVDSAKYHFAVDEKNSIILDCYFNASCLYTKFAGMGSNLLTRMCVNDGVMDYEISSTFSEPVRVSGNGVMGKDTVPEIQSFDLYHLMKAKLKKAQ